MFLFPWIAMILLGLSVDSKTPARKKVDMKTDGNYEDVWKRCGF